MMESHLAEELVCVVVVLKAVKMERHFFEKLVAAMADQMAL